MKLSFKKRPKETGLRSVGNSYPVVDIKGDKKIVGWIEPKNWQKEKYSIWFHVKKDDEVFRNVCLTAKFDTEEEAREFIKVKWSEILEKYTLFQLED